jgi:hypothetical protein
MSASSEKALIVQENTAREMSTTGSSQTLAGDEQLQLRAGALRVIGQITY